MSCARILRNTAAVGSAALLLGLALCGAPAASYASQVRPVSSQDAAGAAAPPGTAALLPAKAGKKVYKYSLSRIAFTGSRTEIVATDSHGDLYDFWEASGKTVWHRETVAASNKYESYNSPVIAWTGHALVIAVLSSAGGLVTFTQQSGHSRWVYSLPVTGRTFLAPSIAVAPNGTVLLSFSSRQGNLYSYEIPPGNSQAMLLTLAPGLFGPSSVTTCYDSLAGQYLALITATQAGSLYFWWQFLGTDSWAQETIAAASQTTAYSGASVAASARHVLVTAATTTGGIDAWSQSIGGTGWTESTVVPLAGTQYSHPEIAWTGPIDGGSASDDVITAASQNGRLSFWYTPDGGAVWLGPERIAGPTRKAAYAHPAFAVTGKAVIVTAINTKPGDVEYWSQKYDTNPWHNQLVAKG